MRSDQIDYLGRGKFRPLDCDSRFRPSDKICINHRVVGRAIRRHWNINLDARPDIRFQRADNQSPAKTYIREPPHCTPQHEPVHHPDGNVDVNPMSPAVIHAQLLQPRRGRSRLRGVDVP
jgi:hypothetical protein